MQIILKNLILPQRRGVMTIPLSSDSVWKDLLLKRKSFDFDFLALKMLLGRLIMDVEQDPSQDNLEKCAAQLYDLMAKNENLPSAKRDIQRILGS
jgi:hypothetical protein